MKIMVDQKLVKRCLKDGMKPYSIAKKQNIPLSVVERIRDGKDVSWFQRKPKSMRKNKDMCECCGMRKKEGRKLCRRCFHDYAGCVGDNENACMSSNNVHMVEHVFCSS